MVKLKNKSSTGTEIEPRTKEDFSQKSQRKLWEMKRRTIKVLTPMKKRGGTRNKMKAV